jgi:hypothetical protein
MTTINATKGELVELVNGLYSVGTLKGKDFGLAVNSNMNILVEKLSGLEALSQPSEEFLTLAKKVQDIVNSKVEDADLKIADLEKEHVTIVDARREQIETVKQAMNEEISVKLPMIPKEVLPEDVTAEQINNINKILV